MAVEIGVTRPLVTKTLRKGAQQKTEIGSKRARSSISETCAIHNPLLRNGLGPGNEPHGAILYNSTALPAGFSRPQAPVFCVPASKIADNLGTTKAANMVMLGALLELTHTMPKDASFAVLSAKVRSAKLLEVDSRAVEAGIECIRKPLNSASSNLHWQEGVLAPCG